MSYPSHAKVKKGCDEMFDTLLNTLEKSIPELKILPLYVEGKSKNTHHILWVIDECPNPKAKKTLDRDYYELSVREDIGWRTVPLYHFFLKKDLTEILFLDTANDRTQPIEKTLATKNWKQTWNVRKKWLAKHTKQ